MFNSVLIANRGEIACRVIRTARRLGVRAIAVYSDADANALHVSLADEAVRIGPAEARLSYLNTDAILDAVAHSAAEAVHPGYGFLSENAEFAEACASRGIVFIGPPPGAIRAMADKATARTLMARAGVPVVPGGQDATRDPAVMAAEAAKIGFPVLLKAVAGGGGRGMRVVERSDDIPAASESAAREAAAAFGDDRLLVEKWIGRPRHVEVQVFADRHGGAIYLHERDCSVQRRHQKVIEEAPAPGLDPALRRRFGEAAVAAARAVGYEGAGTVEFLLDEDGSFYFLEMNTRLQVEHPVTEMITGQDLVDWQFQVAVGQPLPLSQDDVPCNGHAFEARIYAEDPGRDFLPGAGGLRHLRLPADSLHVRVDAGVRQGDAVGVDYDPMIAKVITWDTSRGAALRRMRRALDETQVVGPPSNVEFLSLIAGHPAFGNGDVDTGFIERHRHDLFPESRPASPRVLALAALSVLLRREAEALAVAARSRDPHSPWHATNGWRLNDDSHAVLTFIDGDRPVAVTVYFRAGGLELDVPGAPGPLPVRGQSDDVGDIVADIGGVRVRATVIRDGDALTIMDAGTRHTVTIDDPAARAGQQDASPGGLRAPMPAKVVAVHVSPGDRVARGATVIVLEAMKMEHAVTAPSDGTVVEVRYTVGDQVGEGDDLLRIETT